MTSLSVAGRELLYLEPATLADPSKNVRGGIPVLFPSPGKLTGDRFVRDGRRGALAQHGFARNLPWTPAPADEASIRLTLAASAQTRAQFPWEFKLELHFALDAARLHIGMRVHNPGEVALPYALGFHPYFAVAEKSRAHVATRATTAFDNVRKQVVPYAGLDWRAAEQDFHLLDHGSSDSALELGDGARIAIRASPEFTRWVLWTVAGKAYVCVEPWTAPADALNSGEGLCYVPAGGVHESWVEIAYVR